MTHHRYAAWVEEFRANAARRATTGDPHWRDGCSLPAELVASVQRFQLGEDGDGTTLLAKAAADPDYQAALRLFVAEEQNHARLLGLLLTHAGAPLLTGHWTDAAFVALRRALGLRLELMTLMLAEVVALRYYRALRDGTGDPVLTDVAGRILADEERHVPFHCQRLRESFAATGAAGRAAARAGWWILLAGAVLVVAHDHGRALRTLGVSRRRFAADVLALFRGVTAEVFGHIGKPGPP